jgi:hypothetical protein
MNVLEDSIASCIWQVTIKEHHVDYILERVERARAGMNGFHRVFPREPGE